MDRHNNMTLIYDDSLGQSGAFTVHSDDRIAAHSFGLEERNSDGPELQLPDSVRGLQRPDLRPQRAPSDILSAPLLDRPFSGHNWTNHRSFSSVSGAINYLLDGRLDAFFTTIIGWLKAALAIESTASLPPKASFRESLFPCLGCFRTGAALWRTQPDELADHCGRSERVPACTQRISCAGLDADS